MFDIRCQLPTPRTGDRNGQLRTGPSWTKSTVQHYGIFVNRTTDCVMSEQKSKEQEIY